ncbi:MAG: hypothetical protein MPJ05_07320 [Nitrosopumilus sp.]|nr:hypothetical protein [Nitrosopumilus sp.]MDA7953604.1 hypothetical protein [Nitrosopumilus sp.]
MGGDLISGSMVVNLTKDDGPSFRVSRMLNHEDMRGLSKADVYVTRIATHPDVCGYIIYTYSELESDPSG